MINGFFAWHWRHCFCYHKSILDNIELSVPDGPERRMTVFVQNVFNFIVYLYCLLSFMIRANLHAFLGIRWTQLQRTLAGGSSLRQIFRACTSSGHVSPLCLQIPSPQAAEGSRLCCGFALCVVLPD